MSLKSSPVLFFEAAAGTGIRFRIQVEKMKATQNGKEQSNMNLFRKATLTAALMIVSTSPLRASMVSTNEVGPQIQVVSPALNGACSGKIDLDIRFEATNAPVDLASLRVKIHKLLVFDITDKVRPHVTEAGITWKDLQIPRGTHTIEVLLADANKTKTTRTFTVVVK